MRVTVDLEMFRIFLWVTQGFNREMSAAARFRNRFDRLSVRGG